MRTFVSTMGETRVFWYIHLHSERPGYSVCHGNSTGHPIFVPCHSRDAAHLEVVRLITEKFSQGYEETTTIPWHGGFVSPLRETLEQTLWDNPDDLATHMAYADHLSELGDPRGEFIQVQLALEDDSRSVAARKELQHRHDVLLSQHQRAWLGPMAGFWIDQMDSTDWLGVIPRPKMLMWKRGWVDSLSLSGCSASVLAALQLRHSLLRCVRELRVWNPFSSNETVGDDSSLAQLGVWGNVRIFQAGDETTGDFFHEPVSSAEFYRKMPHLEELHLYNGDTPFAEHFPRLRKLTVSHVNALFRLDLLATNTSMQNLTHLNCWPLGQSEENAWGFGPTLDMEFIRLHEAIALFHSPNLPRLQHLTLRNSDIDDPGIRALIDSGMLARLRTLDLQDSRITDEGAQMLANRPETRGLEMLNLNENLLTQVGISALQAAGVSFSAEDQFNLDAL